MKTWKIVTNIGLILGIVASFITILLVVPKEKYIRLVVNYSSIEYLTPKNINQIVPELNTKYFYKSQPIEQLWKVTLTFDNLSNKTIIGTGTQKNIIYDTLILCVPPGIKLIDKKLKRADFNHNLSISGNKLKISFEQWRKNEILEYNFYVIKDPISTSEKIQSIISLPKFRQIIDGDIIISQNPQKSQQKLVTQNFPDSVRDASYIITIIILGIAIFLLLFLIPTSISGFVVRKKWFKKFGSSFKTFLISSKDTLFSTYHSTETIYKDPTKLSSSAWDKFEGKKYPNLTTDFQLDNTLAFLFFQILFFFCLFSCTIVIIDLFQYFP
jgi:hypothetical protein